MHTQMQVPGQVISQVALGPQQNGNAPNSAGLPSTWPRWQSDQDTSLRRHIVENILQLFKSRKPHVTPEWQQKLPDFVKRLEEALYKNAPSKEDYADLKTLEQRLQSVARRMVPKQQPQSVVTSAPMSITMPTPGTASNIISTVGSGSVMMPTSGGLSSMMPTPGSTGSLIQPGAGVGGGLNNVKSTSGSNNNVMNIVSHGAGIMMPTPGTSSNMMPTPGTSSNMMPTPVTSSNMMPTPGHSNIFTMSGNNLLSTSGVSGASFPTDSQQAMGNARNLAQNGPLQSNLGIGVGSQMIPTPGLNTSQGLGMAPVSSAGLGLPHVSGVGTGQLQHQQYGVGPDNHIYDGTQLSGGLASVVQQQRKPGPSAGVVNGGANNGMILGNGQHLMGGTANLHTQSAYLGTPQYSSLQLQQHQQHQQRISQQQQQRQQHQRSQNILIQSPLPNSMALMAGNGYAMNAADLAGGGFSSGSLASNNLGIASIANSQAPKMIPVPGLPSQQAQQQQQQSNLQQQNQQRTNLQQQLNNGLASRNQPQQLGQPSHNQNIYNSLGLQTSALGGHKQAGLDQSPQQPLSSQMQQTSSESQQFTRKHQNIQSQKMNTIQPQPQPQSHQPSQQQTQQYQQQGIPAQRQQAIQQHLNRLPKSSPQQRQLLTMMQQQKQGLGQQPQHQHPQQQSQQPQPQQLRVAGATQVSAESQFVQQPEAQQQHLNQASQQSIVGEGAPLHRSLGADQQQQSQASQVRQVGGTISSSFPNSSLTAPGQVGGTANGAVSGGSVEPGGLSVDAQRQQQYSKQQRWLLFLRHASKCTAEEGHCKVTQHCHMAKQLWIHIASCRDRECTFSSRCNASRTLLHHHQHCRDARCPVCGPVRQQVMNQQRVQASSQAVHLGGPAASASNTGTPAVSSTVLSPSGIESCPTSEAQTFEDIDGQQPPPKRVKTEPPSVNNVSLPVPTTLPSGPSKSGGAKASSVQLPVRSQVVGAKSVQVSVKTEIVGSSGPVSAKAEEQLNGHQAGVTLSSVKVEAPIQSKTDSRQAVSNTAVKSESLNGSPSTPAKGEPSGGAAPMTNATTISTKTGKPKNLGTSLTELFTPEQIREHITGLRQWVGQSKAKAEKNQALSEHQISENACQLCAVEKLTFEPPPIYCTACGVRIKRNALYYVFGSGDARHHFCVPCYNDVRSENVEMEGSTYPKSKLEKRKNDEETEEAWVQCDKCNLWQHQVCALFNGRRNEGDSEYICPECCRVEMERGERKPLPPSAVLGAKDLPKSFLSDHLEQRLARKLKQERAERAKAQGKNTDEVASAEALVVRVVSSVDKKLEVKQRFLEIFQDYPTEYPYKSKVVLLFQKIEGVEVCLFGMYVQEFGVECSLPNQRRVYLSYLDSVKYFRPDVRTVNGEALRTFVYHEILIGYLDYCRRRGFSSCYIWACPPLKGEDYILYCHPEIQKTPKSDKLRDWYLTMLRKASTDGIVVEITNLYDYFFTSTGECKAKVTAARLPYFDGDYWPGAAEDMIVQLQQEEEDVRNNILKKGKTKKQPTKRSSKGLVQTELPSNASKDTQLMQKLGESIFPMKEDFIMVHMHHACSHCRLFIVCGRRWVCKQCKNFQLCDECYDAEQKLDERDRHPINVKELHSFQSVEIQDVPSDTKDKDELMESEFFDTRQAFLSLCQGNHYQYDTLRRAKHSSMMVLYHLHNPTAPAFVVSCNICHQDIEAGNGWRCETCADFDLCNKCKDLAKHPHKLTPFHDRNAQNKEARQQRVLQLRKMLELLVHASQCGLGTCQYPKCRNVKGLFRHGMNCRVRASGGCNLCKRMWYLLQLHARACKESECRVPRCKDLKEHLRRLQQQMESRRRVAVMEMMRQRAAEAAGTNS